MKVNIRGRVSNISLPYRQSMRPIYEAIFNSLQSLEDVSEERDKFIKIRFYRDDKQQPLIEDKDPYYDPINDFEIIDNGIGFDKVNYDSFLTSDTRLKKKRGGKGVGRFLWLKAFEKVKVDSKFYEEDKMKKRKFDFSLIENGISNHKIEEIEENNPITKVILKNLNPSYQEYMPKKLETLGFQILEHLLVYFILGDPPSITIEDVTMGEKINLIDIYNEEIKPNKKEINFKMSGHDFKMCLVKSFTNKEKNHKVYYCAHQREVINNNIQSYIPILGQKLVEKDGREFVVMAYLTSEYLDSRVNQERTRFNMSKEKENDNLFSDQFLSFKEIKTRVKEELEEKLDKYLEPLREKHYKRIKKYVQNNNPQYRSVLNYKREELYNISPKVQGEDLEFELHKINQELELEIKKESQELLKLNDEIMSTEEYKNKYKKFTEKVSDFGRSKLAEYVIHRKIIIQLLEKSLCKKEDGKYELEESIHELIFPLRSSSEDIEQEKHNLWLIDEKLAYHQFLASDISFKKNPMTDSESQKRPDLLIFNKAVAFVEDNTPYSSVVIVEFKRPARNNYNEDKNPVNQVLNYIRELREGRALDDNGRPVRIEDNTPFYGYIVCDITHKIERFAENYSYTETPDRMGYFGYNQNLNCYIEIISFDKLLDDAKKRNQVLFNKLGLSASKLGLSAESFR